MADKDKSLWFQSMRSEDDDTPMPDTLTPWIKKQISGEAPPVRPPVGTEHAAQAMRKFGDVRAAGAMEGVKPLPPRPVTNMSIEPLTPAPQFAPSLPPQNLVLPLDRRPVNRT